MSYAILGFGKIGQALAHAVARKNIDSWSTFMHAARPPLSVNLQGPLDIPPAIQIRSLVPGDDATAFRTLNEKWITRYFTLESKDREILNDPANSILRKGGHIFMAYAGAEAVGCVALIPMRVGIYELSKMAVSPQLRGNSSAAVCSNML